MYAAYTLLYLIGLCAYVPRFVWGRVFAGRYRGRLSERLGRVPAELAAAPSGGIWVHAVSVGEVHAARALLAHLRPRLPGVGVVLSTTTDTGQELAARAGADATFYNPLDLPWTVGPFLDWLRPRALILVETEIWPNLLRACRRRNIPVAVVNGRLSAASFARYRRLGGWWRRIVGELVLVCARSAPEAARFRALGVPASRVFVTGNLKADAVVLASPREARERLADQLGLNGKAPLLVAGCTMPGEEEAVLEAFGTARAACPGVRLLLAPRHPERFDDVARAIAAAGWSCRRRCTGGPDDAEVLLLDTIGELPAAYGLGTASFVGGSLVPTGGHNLLEPAVYGQPVLFGPHVFNFAGLARAFREAGAAVQVDSGAALGEEWRSLLQDSDRREAMGARAREVAMRDAGTGRRTVRVLMRQLGRPTG